MKIGELAARSGTTAKTVRFYEQVACCPIRTGNPTATGITRPTWLKACRSPAEARPAACLSAKCARSLRSTIAVILLAVMCGDFA